MLFAIEQGTDLTTDFVRGMTTVGGDGHVKDIARIVADRVQAGLTTLKHCRSAESVDSWNKRNPKHVAGSEILMEKLRKEDGSCQHYIKILAVCTALQPHTKAKKKASCRSSCRMCELPSWVSRSSRSTYRYILFRTSIGGLPGPLSWL